MEATMPEIPRSSLPSRRPRGTRTSLRSTRAKPAETIACACGLYQRRGIWHAGRPPLGAVRAGLCPACERLRSGTAAGRVRVPARLATAPDEIIGLVRNCEHGERAEHPLERLMRIDSDQGGLVFTTTGPHLARSIAHRLARRFHEKPRFRFGAGRGELRVDWGG
jgi:hypothetical protein